MGSIMGSGGGTAVSVGVPVEVAADPDRLENIILHPVRKMITTKSNMESYPEYQLQVEE